MTRASFATQKTFFSSVDSNSYGDLGIEARLQRV